MPFFSILKDETVFRMLAVTGASPELSACANASKVGDCLETNLKSKISLLLHIEAPHAFELSFDTQNESITYKEMQS